MPELFDLWEVALGDAEHPDDLLVDGVEVADELPPLLLLPHDLREVISLLQNVVIRNGLK